MAKLCTWHSHRSTLATRLHASHATVGDIQAMLRWKSEESLRAYLRLSRHFQSKMLAAAEHASVAAVQSTNVPLYERFDLFVCMNEALDVIPSAA